jgi:membrane peptidoglycan carboxypeptidase
MVDMATAYSAFATSGNRVNLKPVLKVKDYLGHTLEDNTTPDWQSQNTLPVISPKTAYLINNILSDDGARAPTFGRGSILNVPNHQVAVKTGTTETKRDNWTIGFTPSFLVAVWVGNNDNSPMSPFLESGNTGAAAIWNPIFQEVLKDQPNETFTPPANLIPVQICSVNGLLPCENCPQVNTELFTPGTEPKIACNITKEERDRFLKQTDPRPN